MDMVKRTGLAAVALTGILIFQPFAARACDDFADRLVSKAVAPAIEGLKCEGIGKAGLDKPNHHLTSVCYTSSGPVSNLEIVADLQCKTSDKAVFKNSISATVTATVQVRGADCQLTDVNVKTSGALANFALQAFGVNGAARPRLQEALNRLCQ
ncbi:hypothetical protein [Mesorhizobium sp.]|uniref:hypothetical protein n=1 Tax=Mesorhizobium sp. TaxID=1871066 RepID=UPI000FE7FF11|nr:hypothetical protein [Mesorhizobium sp.]RWF99696.1 MAG: hypothetical protein EOQ54_28710 [Mesorhizobium sp.]RWG94301.1 MAG: hypothetical protein EOQ72_27855 [Mesorhizobium sp.]TIR89649.1 MAG: hypothetical protein E5X08_26640 [Mesorhizobium sp.]